MCKLQASPLLNKMTHNIAFFIAGGFTISLVNPPWFANVRSADNLVYIAGWILILTALFLVFASLSYKRLEHLNKRIQNYADVYIYPILFTVTSAEVLTVMINLSNIGLFISGIILFVLLYWSIIINSKAKLKQDLCPLFFLSGSFCATSGLLCFFEASQLSYLAVLGLGVSIFIIAVIKLVLLTKRFRPTSIIS